MLYIAIMNALSGRTALITGSARGIGRAIAIRLAKEGAIVLINYRHSKSEALRLVAEIKSGGGNADAIQGDVSNADDVNRIAREISTKHGPVHILVNNAAEIVRPGDWKNQSAAATERTIGATLTSAIYCIRSFAPDMIDARWGAIINISSVYGQVGAAAVLSYCAAKAGIDAITRSMARELGQFGITVNGIAPSVVRTSMTEGADKDFEANAIDATPIHRLVTKEEIAEATFFLITARYITGQTLVVDGGQMLNI
jgi:3-oxoacyl-[acyl-carrier protein] reductase